MVAATRPGYDLSRLDHLEAALRNFDRIFPVECTRVDISATAIRRKMLQRKVSGTWCLRGYVRLSRTEGSTEEMEVERKEGL